MFCPRHDQDRLRTELYRKKITVFGKPALENYLRSRSISTRCPMTGKRPDSIGGSVVSIDILYTRYTTSRIPKRLFQN